MSKPFSAYRGDEPYTFVCYAHEDADVVYPELVWLRERGVNIWYDEGISAGTNWRASIGDSLIDAHRVLFYVSKSSLASDHCNREINLALDEGKELVPVYLESVELTSDLKVGLNRVQALHREKEPDYRQRLLVTLGSRPAETDDAGLDSKLAMFGRRRIRLVTALAIATIVGVLGAIIGVWSNKLPVSAISERPTRSFAIDIGRTDSLLPPVWPMLPTDLAIAPDGSHFVYAVNYGGVRGLYRRKLADINPTILWQGSAQAPFFSPDGQWVAFYYFHDTGAELIKVSAADGRSKKIADAWPSTGGTWLPDDTIIHTNNPRGSAESGLWPDGHGEALYRVSADGGEPEQITWIDTEAGEWAHSSPSALPGGKHVLFDRRFAAGGKTTATDVQLLDLETGELVTLIEQARGAQYVPSGHLVFVRDGAVWGVRFDLDNLKIDGDATLIETSVTDVPGFGNRPIVVASDGSAVILPATAESIAQRRPVWVDRNGRMQTSGMPAGPYEWPRVSPDGTRVVLERRHGLTNDIWIHDTQRPGSLFRLTFHDGLDVSPVWERDGAHLLFGSSRDGQLNVYRMRHDGSGSPERLIRSPMPQAPAALTPDGTSLIYAELGSESSWDIGAYSLDGTEDPRIIFQTEFTEGTVSFSPDGKWMAYGSDESGSANIYVRPFPNLDDGKWQISTAGGFEAFWSPNGDEIFYRNEGTMYAVPVTTAPTFRPGLPQALFEDNYFRVPLGTRQYDMSYTDGEKWLMLEPLPERDTTHLIYVENWVTKLERLAR